MHLDDAGDDPVELPQPLDETRDDHDLAAVPLEELLGVVQPRGSEEDVLAEPLDQLAAAEAADRVADVVTGDRGHEARSARPARC